MVALSENRTVTKKGEKLIYTYIIGLLVYHIICFYGIFTFPYFNKKRTFAWLIVSYSLTMIGLAGGVHRFWAHSSYKAKWPVRLILAIFFYSSGQFKLKTWVKLHRAYHKYTETDADPHNTKRGFFFAHMGWTMLERHPECIKKMRQLNITDIMADPIVKFGDRFYGITVLTCAIILPSLVPIIFWNETYYWAVMSQFFMRTFFTTHVSGLGNSLLHMWGTKPYNRNVNSVNNRIMNIISLGDGWHNYHHSFPTDYKSAEFGFYKFNFVTFLIELLAKIGLVYDLKQSSEALVKMTCERKGDGSHPKWKTEFPFISNNIDAKI